MMLMSGCPAVFGVISVKFTLRGWVIINIANKL